MKTISDKIESFKVVGVKPGFNQHEENGDSAFEDHHREELSRQVEGHLLLPEGLHLRLPDRDRRVRQAGQAVRGPRRGGAGRLDRQRVLQARLAARAQGPDKLGHWSFADTNGSLVDQLGVRDKAEGVALRATFIVDPDNVIQHVSVNNLNVGRNPDDTLRILDALQTDELCPCNRGVGGATL